MVVEEKKLEADTEKEGYYKWQRERERIKDVGSKRGRRLYVWNDGHLLMF